eukprot:TCONS_00059102-protein
MANITSCNDIMKQIQSGGTIHPGIINNICGLYDQRPNTTIWNAEEELFYQYCCNPAPQFLHNISGNSFVTDKIMDFKDFLVSGDNHCSGYQKHICELWDLLTIIILSVLTPIGLATNTTVLSLVGKIKKYRECASGYLRNLAVVNFLVIFQTISMVILYESGVMYKFSIGVQNYFLPTIELVLGSAAMLFVAALALERYKAVRKPNNGARKNRFRIFIWVYCFVLLICGLIRIKYSYGAHGRVFFYVTAVLGFILPFLVVVGAYCVVIFSAFKYRNTKIQSGVSENIQSLTSAIEVDDTGENLKDEEGSAEHLIFIESNDVPKMWKSNLSIPDLNLKESFANFGIQDISLVNYTRSQDIKISFQIGAMILPIICGWIYYISSFAYEKISRRFIFGMQYWSVLFVPFIVSCLSPLIFMIFTWSMWRRAFCQWYKKFLHDLEQEHTVL